MGPIQSCSHPLNEASYTVGETNHLEFWYQDCCESLTCTILLQRLFLQFCAQPSTPLVCISVVVVCLHCIACKQRQLVQSTNKEGIPAQLFRVMMKNEETSAAAAVNDSSLDVTTRPSQPIRSTRLKKTDALCPEYDQATFSCC
jgi:hypothetical protein